MTLLERKRRVLMPGVMHYHGDDPIELVRGAGCHVWDAQGREYLDLYSGVAVNNLGHCHPEMVEAACRQMRMLQHTTTIHLTEPMIALAERLVEIAGGRAARVFFCADGSGANEGALVAARMATGRRDFITLEGSLHGRTSLTMAVTGLDMWQCDPFLPACAYRLRCPCATSAEECLADLEEILLTAPAESIAGMIVEPVIGNGGIIPVPPGFLRRAHEMLRAHGALLIVDEMQTGFCRTGRWFGHQLEDVEPDLITVGKALANGHPAAAWIASEAVSAKCNRPIASTFGGNLPAMMAGLKTIEIMQRDELAAGAQRKGRVLLDALSELASGCEWIADVRGTGLMIGMELTHALSKSAGEVTEEVLLGLRRNGILAGKTGPARNVLTLQPPLIIEEADLLRAVDVLATVLASVERSCACC